MKTLLLLSVLLFPGLYQIAKAQETLYTTPLYSCNAWTNDLTTANVAWKSTQGCVVKGSGVNQVTLCPTGGVTELKNRDSKFAHCEFVDAATKFLIASDFQIDLTNNLPDGLTKQDIEIRAIEIRIEKYSNVTFIKDNQVRLIKNGNINVTGYHINESDKAKKVTPWKSTATVHLYGGDDDTYPLWGTSWTVDDLENANFGVAFSAVSPDPGNNIFAYVGMIRARVTYAKKPNVLPLPVELARFNAHAKARQIELSWTTASEKNNDFFAVEKSENGKDFKIIGTVKGAGNSQTIREYQYTDATYSPQTVYYRLKQTDFDGTFAYSSIVAVTTKGDFKPSVNLYPNPSNGRNLKITSNFLDRAQTELTIYNQNGALIHQLKIEPVSGQDIMLKDLADLKPGLYYAVLTQDKLVCKEKLLIE